MSDISFSNFQYSIIAIFIMSSLTLFLRFIPFIIFANKTPKIIIYLGSILPYAIIGMLLIYCLKNINFLDKNKFFPELISIIVIIILHKWKHNTLLSISLGTLSYMFLVQEIFN